MSKTPVARLIAGRNAAVNLTAGQKAAETKRLNALAISGKSARPVASASKPVASETAEPGLHLTVSADASGLILRIGSDAAELPECFGWQIMATLKDGRLIGHDVVRLSLSDADAATLADASREVSELQDGISADQEASDDRTFARVVSYVAGHYAVKSLHLMQPDGTSVEIRRGESYFKLHQYAAEFVARQTTKPAAVA
jgi:hypothetical protein